MSEKIEPFDLDGLVARTAAGWRPKYLLFWGHRGLADKPGPHVLSQWWPAGFNLDGMTYATAEHAMMAGKARLFSDETALAKVLAARSPGAAKAAGREVRGFNEEIWARHRFELVVRANVAKFGQNSVLADYLATTGDKVLVEASPVDRIWGIGLARDHANAQKPQRWRGLNLLGFALMKTRAILAGRLPQV